MQHIVIVGGGTSGWLTAAYLASKLGSYSNTPLQFTLIESSDIPIIGVGEATTPSIRATLADIGFDEFDFMQLCDATFKHGILFRGWNSPELDNSPERENSPELDNSPELGNSPERLNAKVNDLEQANSYFHPFERPLRAGTDGLENYWLRQLDPLNRPFHDAVSIQHQVAMAGLAPKTQNDKPYDAPLPYAYHLDAGKLASALKQAAKQRGVQHKIATIADITLKHQQIDSLTTTTGEKITADLFIDCTGFSGKLISQLPKQQFKDYNHILFCNAAVTVQLPYTSSTNTAQQQTIQPYTSATAEKNGWTWDIALTTRRGIGHVYSRHHQSPEQAEQVLQDYLAREYPAALEQHGKQLNTRHLNFNVGYRPKQWQGNCVSVGLSAGFLEPLESTGIHLVEQAIWALSSLIPRYLAQQSGANNPSSSSAETNSIQKNATRIQASFNQLMNDHYEHAIHFVKYHYILSQRKDSQFWLDNVNEASWTPWLKEQVANWQFGYPDIYDMRNLHTIFDHGSYQYVFFGMNGKPNLGDIGGKRQQFAQRIFHRVEQGVSNAKQRLPSHLSLLHHIHKRVNTSNINGSHSSENTNLEKNAMQNAQVNSSIRGVPNNYKAGL